MSLETTCLVMIIFDRELLLHCGRKKLFRSGRAGLYLLQQYPGPGPWIKGLYVFCGLLLMFFFFFFKSTNSIPKDVSSTVFPTRMGVMLHSSLFIELVRSADLVLCFRGGEQRHSSGESLEGFKYSHTAAGGTRIPDCVGIQ